MKRADLPPGALRQLAKLRVGPLQSEANFVSLSACAIGISGDVGEQDYFE